MQTRHRVGYVGLAVSQVFSVAVLVASAAAGQKESTTICHMPLGAPGNAHTITVSTAALPAHIGHGDTIGECTPACTGNGEACGTHEECCSGLCEDGECATPCVENGSGCGEAGECCSGACTDGICVTPCGNVGAACNEDAQCCTGNCQNGACAAACTGNGESCSTGSECCSGTCQDGTCAAACTANGDDCTSDGDCCSGLCSHEGICAAECTIGTEGGGAYCNFEIPCCAGSGFCYGGACFNGEEYACQPHLDGPCSNEPGNIIPCCFDNSCDDATNTCKFFP